VTDIDWTRTAVVMVLPDAIVRHRAVALLEDLFAEGFEPLEYRLIEPGPQEIDDMYRTNIEGVWETYRYRALDRLYEFGPSLYVLIADRSARGPGEGHEYLQELKGSGNLHKAPPNCLRRRHGAINTMLALMHSSASPHDAETEARILSRPTHLQGEPDRATPVLQFAALLQDGYPEEVRDYDHCLAAYRARLLIALWELLDASGRERALAAADGTGLAEPGVGAEIAARLRDDVDPMLVTALAYDFDGTEPPVPPERIWRSLNGHGIKIDRWEHLVLSSCAYFEPLRRRDAGVQRAA
jgi:nucleoside diphosphate kinase